MAVTAQDIVAAFNAAGLEDRAAVVRVLSQLVPLSDERRKQRLDNLLARRGQLHNAIATLDEEIAELGA